MAVYRCDECDNLIDEDYHGCNEHPKGMCCDDCATDLTCVDCEEMQESESELDTDGLCYHCAYKASEMKRERAEYDADRRRDQMRDDRMSREYEQEQRDTHNTLEH